MRNSINQYKELVFIAIIFTVLRLASLFFMGLMPQDAYYSYYSENLALSYFDHPPMIAYMIKLFTSLFGKSVLTLHFADFIVTSATLFITYTLIKRSTENETGQKAMILLLTAPFVTVLSINSTPDVPLLFFWSLSLLLGFRALEDGRWFWWILSGLAAGFAFDSKYTGILLPAGMLLYLLISKEHRKFLLSKEFTLYAFSFVVAVLPVIIWNLDNDFISFRYQSAERASDITKFNFDPKLFPGFLGSQLVLALPLLLLPIFYAGYKIISRLINGERQEWYQIYFASFALPMLFLFTSLSFVYWVKINWIMPVYITGALLAASVIKGRKALRYQTAISMLAHIGLIIQIIWMPIAVKSDDTWSGWDELSNKVEQLDKSGENRFIFSDNSYKISAILNFYLEEHVYAGNVIGQSAYQFALDNHDLSHLDGMDALYVTSERYRKKRAKDGPPEEYLLPYFSSVEMIDSLVIYDIDGEEERKFFFYECLDYSLENVSR